MMEILNPASAFDEKRENVDCHFQETTRITAKQRKERRRKLQKQTNLLEISPSNTVLNENALKQMKLQLLKNRAANSSLAILSKPRKSTQTDEMETKLGDGLEIVGLKRQRTEDHLNEILHEREIKRIVKQQQSVMSSTRLTNDVKKDKELAAFFLARFMVDFSENYNIIPAEVKPAAMNTVEATNANSIRTSAGSNKSDVHTIHGETDSVSDYESLPSITPYLFCNDSEETNNNSTNPTQSVLTVAETDFLQENFLEDPAFGGDLVLFTPRFAHVGVDCASQFKLCDQAETMGSPSFTSQQMVSGDFQLDF